MAYSKASSRVKSMVLVYGIHICAKIQICHREFMDTFLQNRPATYSGSSNQINANGLIIPKSSTPYVKKNKPNAKFWTKDDWKNYQKNCDARNRTYGKLDFMTDEHGEAVGRSRLAAMSTRARELFMTLRRHERDPVTWRTRGAEEAEYFSNCMNAAFPEFKLCENDWKVQAFATERYPDWCKDVRNLRMDSRLFYLLVLKADNFSSRITRTF